MRAHLPRTLAPHVLVRLVLVVLAFSACATFPGSFSIVNPNPTPYYLPDTPASALDVTVSISVVGSFLSGVGSVGAVVSVSFHVPGHLVGFRAGEALSCGWQVLVLSSMGYGHDYVFSPTDVGASHPFSCTYTSKGRATTFTVVIPVAPEIISPAEGVTLLVAPALPITYQFISGPAELDVFSGMNTPRADTKVKITNPHHMTLNTSAFVAGSGLIEIQDVPPVHVIAAGGFHSFSVHCSGRATIDVTWV